MLSLPSWECGLKYEYLQGTAETYSVTPFVGVWIEILLLSFYHCPLHVTPFVGVWIEIQQRKLGTRSQSVTPFVGVWIEMTIIATHFLLILSLPSWECGLK